MSVHISVRMSVYTTPGISLHMSRTSFNIFVHISARMSMNSCFTHVHVHDYVQVRTHVCRVHAHIALHMCMHMSVYMPLPMPVHTFGTHRFTQAVTSSWNHGSADSQPAESTNVSGSCHTVLPNVTNLQPRLVARIRSIRRVADSVGSLYACLYTSPSPCLYICLYTCVCPNRKHASGSANAHGQR